MKCILTLIVLVSAPVSPLSAMTLGEALSACEDLVATKTIPDGLAIDPASLTGTKGAGEVETEVGKLALTFDTDLGPDHRTECTLMGTDTFAPTVPFDVTVREALPIADRWLRERAAATGGTVRGFGLEWSLAICVEDRERHITVIPVTIRGVKGLPDEDQPFHIQIRDMGTSGRSFCPD